MSVPLDRLYHYIESIANKVYGNVVISRFWPHGSKKLEDLCYLHDSDWYNTMVHPNVVCHDQEPLNFDYYQNYPITDRMIELEKKYNCYKPRNLRKLNMFDQIILVHSEQRSSQIDIYQANNFIPVYYWSHAIIALDWFRFAQHQDQTKNSKKTFLIYNRAWTGTREYRIKFVELVFNLNLTDHCQLSFNKVDPESGIHYHDHEYKNPIWRPEQDLPDSLPPSTATSQCSADFDLSDYENTDIEIVLETLFDDKRLHLTEKILRPIACEQPFILASTPGSLEYVKSYGFKTYDSVWDESYDKITDPLQRLKAITTLMKQISTWDLATKEKKLAQARSIAQFNKQHFFSQEFFYKVNEELTTNLQQGLDLLISSNTSSVWLNRHRERCQFSEIKNIVTGRVSLGNAGGTTSLFRDTVFKTSEVMKVLQEARKYNTHKKL